MEEIIGFNNNAGQKLYGVLHSPEPGNTVKRSLVIMLNSGLLDRVGPHRLYVKIARMLCRQGFYVFRFDSHGLGHSEGELVSGPSVLNFVKIENGFFVEDVLGAINFLSQKIDPDKIFMTGLCGGGVTSLLAADIDKRISGVISLDPPVYLDSAQEDYDVNPLAAMMALESPLKKIFNLKYWLKLVTFKINPLKLGQMVFMVIKEKTRKKEGRDKEEGFGRPLNRKFVNAFTSYVASKRNILFITGQNDFVAKEFKYKFQNRYLTGKNKEWFEVLSVVNANHEFHSLDSQQVLLEKISNWLAIQNNR
ncbi:MAG: alpha/beta fold hydrolase [Candidatus Omnitrophota bacterium]|jgi:hypothetical protein